MGYDILYFLISIVATLLGSMTGAGGGVIMQPVISLMNQYGAATISILISFTLIGMGIVNVGGHIYKKTKIDFRFAALMVLGAVPGGVIGGDILDYIIANVGSNEKVKSIQNIILLIVMVISVIYMNNRDKIKGHHFKKPVVIVSLAFALGVISSFLDIGGGPLNVSVMIFFFSIAAKDSAIYSVILIIFAQCAKMVSFFITNGFNGYNLHVMPYMIIGGILGGYFGAALNKKLSEKTIVNIFNIIQVVVIITCLLNVIR